VSNQIFKLQTELPNWSNCNLNPNHDSDLPITVTSNQHFNLVLAIAYKRFLFLAFYIHVKHAGLKTAVVECVPKSGHFLRRCNKSCAIIWLHSN